MVANAGIHLDGHGVAFAAALALVSAIVFGLAPAAHAARTDPIRSLAGGRGSHGAGTRRWLGPLVAAETALTLVLLAGAGLALRSLNSLASVDAGFEAGDIEGYVVRSPCAVEPMRVVCTAGSVESGPGMRSRLTLTIADRYRFEEAFELAAPGEELAIYFHERLAPGSRFERLTLPEARLCGVGGAPAPPGERPSVGTGRAAIGQTSGRRFRRRSKASSASPTACARRVRWHAIRRLTFERG